MASRRQRKLKQEQRRRSRFTARKQVLTGRGGPTDVREASLGGAFLRPLIRPVARAVSRSPAGRRVATIARQQLIRIPGLRKFARTSERARQRGAVGQTGSALSTTPSRGGRIARRVAVPLATTVAAGAIFEGGAQLFREASPGIDLERGVELARGARRGLSRRGPQTIDFNVGQTIAPHQVVKTWVANGVPFAQLADGRVMVKKKNGTIKTFRRPKPIVLGRNPGVRDIVRADKKIEALMKVMRKRMPAARRRSAPPRGAAHIARDV